jgi:hypothetical protein
MARSARVLIHFFLPFALSLVEGLFRTHSEDRFDGLSANGIREEQKKRRTEEERTTREQCLRSKKAGLPRPSVVHLTTFQLNAVSRVDR